jgi:ElaA protein
MAGAGASDLEWRSFADLSAPLLYELLRFRQAIFVVEQASPYADLDGIDHDARHLLARHRGSLVGCLRLYRRDGQGHIGRLAVAPAWRGRGLGRRMMGEALAACGGDFPGEPVALSAQAHLRRFYESFGFVAVSDEYNDCGVPHIDMLR